MPCCEPSRAVTDVEPISTGYLPSLLVQGNQIDACQVKKGISKSTHAMHLEISSLAYMQKAIPSEFDPDRRVQFSNGQE